MADIVIINPRFDISFWGMELVLPLMGKPIRSLCGPVARPKARAGRRIAIPVILNSLAMLECKIYGDRDAPDERVG